MKKLTALFLAFVLVLSLSAIALATGEAVGGDGNTGITKVNVEVNSDNISVTVPLSFTIVAKVDGGLADVPTGYTIKNNSRIPVKVDTIAVSLANTDWAFKSDAIEANTAPTTNGVNDIYLSINGYVLEASTLNEGVPVGVKPTNASDWNIPAHNGTIQGEKNLTIVASTSRLDQTTAANDLITITYVISAGSHS